MALAYASCVEREAREGVSTEKATDAGDVAWTEVRDTTVSHVYEPTPVPAPPLRRTEVVALLYTREIGVREATGHNDGSRVEEYLAAAGRRKGEAWCAAFVTWVFVQAGVEAAVSGWSPAWFPADRTVYVRGKAENLTPQQADVFGIYFPDAGRIAHVGFVDRWDDGSLTVTVEGNTNEAGSREGDGVYRKRRLKTQVYKISRWVN